MNTGDRTKTEMSRIIDGRAPRKLSQLLALVFVLVGLTIVGVSSAEASPSRFVLEECDSALPGGGVPVSEHSYSPAMAPVQNCAAPGGSIGLVETEAMTSGATPNGSFGALYVSVPATPGGYVENETITSVQSGVELPYSHINENGFPGPQAEETRVFHEHDEASLFGWNGGSLEIYESCGAGSCPAGPFIAAHYIAATEVDANAPTLGVLSGTAIAAGVLRGSQTLAAEAKDTGGGLTSVSVVVNGQTAGTPVTGSCAVAQVSNRSAYGTVAYSASPCSPSLKGEWTLDTESYPFHNGSNTIQVCASDFSTIGSPNVTCSPVRTVEVDNSCSPSAVAGGEQLSAQFSRTNAETQTVGFGMEAEVTGQLHNNAGEPVSGATLCVKATTLETGAPLTGVATVQTDAVGQYAYKVPPGPNREFMIGYRHDTAQVAREVRYYAHTRPTLRAKPTKLRNGEKVELRGALPQPGAAGRVVVLQANVPGSHRWITFRKATTGPRGGFKAKYHFSSTTRKITYRFRALVPRQAGYPWDQGASKSVPVVVAR
jgi:hypothetical protein